ncbi:hypothetical protein [Luteimonas terricola]|uniref:Uncharacterized protein n=1 Tax=Luteimonas terricola TaxID=645597 RepID=A0ABQ2EEU1_9GAMM|nr:hypothetical protein [Luteimonas terricola]GGK08711.1 hypothetical protein GCM10011394_17630 [Luteimonas terricola]
MDRVQRLAASMVNLGESASETHAGLHVLELAVAALIRSHPAPERFAEEFRRYWLQSGSLHSDDEVDPVAAARIDSALSILEEACPVPLRVRPPRTGG